MPIMFDRSVCCDLKETISREWLITNGQGGYAAGTVAGVLTRMQHGLLVALPPNTVMPQLLLAKIDEEVVFDQRTYYLGTNEYRDGTINPAGFVHLETFRLEEGFPIFTYHVGGINGIILEKRIWMLRELNTTCIQYRVFNSETHDRTGYHSHKSSTTGSLLYHQEHEQQRSLMLTLLPLAAYRAYNQPQYGHNNWQFQVQVHRAADAGAKNAWELAQPLPLGAAGCMIRARKDAHPYHIVALGQPGSQVTFIPTGVWYWNFQRRHDAAAGGISADDLYLPGVIRARLQPGEEGTLTIVVSAEEFSSLPLHQIDETYRWNIERQQQLFSNAVQTQRYFGEGGEAAQAHHLRVLPLTITSDPHAGGEEYLRHLLQAGDHFLSHYKILRQDQAGYQDILSGGTKSMPALLSGYYTMEHRTRDTLIALPGLTLVTGQFDEARRLLYEIARHFKGGLLPDHLSLSDQPVCDDDYGSVDNTLWFFYALDYYLRFTRDYEFLQELYPGLKDAIYSYMQGTLQGVHLDRTDGLLCAQQPGKALTWMNATINGIPVTPRAGKAVEVNALWYHSLCLMQEWSQYISHMGKFADLSSYYKELLTLCRSSFQQRFWYEQGKHLYDVVDGPGGNDTTLRPNQLLALSLRYNVVDRAYAQSVFDTVTQHLLTPYGLRTLAPDDASYYGHLGTRQDEQQRALHQGSSWPWLLGPYIDAMLTMHYQPSASASQQDESLWHEYLWRKGVQLLEPFKERLNEGLLGMCAEVLAGDPPYNDEQQESSALSMGELLRIYDLLASMRVSQPEHILAH